MGLRYQLPALALALVLALTGAAQANVLTGSYTGTGATKSVTTNFKPDVVIIKASSASQDMVIRTSTMSGDATKDMVGALVLFPNGITSLDPSGFTLGTDLRVNASGTTYQWVAFKAAPGELVVGSYTGNSQAARDITGLGLGAQPDLLYILSAGNNLPVFREYLSGDFALPFDASTPVTTNQITALGTDKFTLGTDAKVNSLGTVYHYVAWRKVTGKMDSSGYTGSQTTIYPSNLVGVAPVWVMVKRSGTSAMVSKPSSLGSTTSLFATATASITTGITALNVSSFSLGGDVSVSKSGSNNYYWAAFAQPSCAAVSDATYLAATASPGTVTVHWSSSNPVLILRKAGAAVTQTPLNGFSYARNETPWGVADGTTVVYTGSATESSVTDGGLANGTTYYYKVFAKDSKACYAPGIPVSATPQAGPRPAWSYTLATPAGSMLSSGIAGPGSLYSVANSGRMIALDTGTGLPNWKPYATNGLTQGYLLWLPSNGGDTTSGLLGYWKLDDCNGTGCSGTVAADSSGNGRNGTVVGTISTTTPTWTSGRLSGALSFDGPTNYVSVPHNVALNAYPITVSAWFKTSGTPSSSWGIVTKHAASTAEGYDLYITSGGLLATEYYGGSSSNQANINANALYKVNDNTWHHAVLIVDTPANGGSKLYLDGALIGSSPWTGTAQATTSTQDLLIGNMPTSSSNYYQGLIDDVRVYNRALTAGQVTDLYNSTAANYAYHQAITITTGSAGTPSGYSVPVTLNHASLVAAGKSRADGNDVRVYYLTSDNRLVELDRVLDTDPTVGAWNQATTKIWFKTQAAIPANSVDDNYFLYYGAPAATGALANPSNVYLVSDDFESGTLSKWQGDTTYFASTTTRAHTGTRSVQGGPEASLSRYLMANPALDLADVYVEAWWNVSDTTSNDIQTVVRAWSAISPSYRYETTLKPNPTPGWNIAKDLNLTRTELSAPLGTVTANTWTRIGLGVYGTKARMFKDGAQLNPASGSLDVGTDLASGTVGFGKYSLTGTWWIDDVIARRYVDPEPTAALTGVEEGAWGRFGNQSMIVGGDQSGYVYSVDGDSGLLNWTVNFSGSGLNRANGIQAPVAAQLRAYTGASLPGGADLIFVPSYNTTGLNCGTDKTGNKVFALRSTDGAVQWTFNDTCTSAMDYVAGMPAVDYGRNRLYVTSGDGGAGQSTFWFINTLDGTLFGSVALGKIDASPTPSYDGSTVYVAAGATPATTTLYAVKADLTCGTPPCTWTIANATRWSLALGSALTGFIWEDYVTPGKLYFTTADGKVWCIQAGAGCSGWPAGGQVQLGASGSLLVMDTNYAYVGTSPLLSCSGAGISCNGANGDGKLHQVSLANGTDAKVPFPTSGALDGTAVGDVSTETGSEVYVGTNGGRLFKIAVPLP